MMENTVKLFYEDAFMAEFDATVLSCEPYKDGYKAVLDRTAFFPEGGGQYGDTGYLDEIRVTDTKEKDGVIFHIIDAPIEAGKSAHGKLDWEKRFDRMQQHSGEHIVSGIVHHRFGYNNVGFHLADDYCTMDFDGPITKEQLLEIENEANQAIFQNFPVNVLYPAKEKLHELDYRSKIEIEGQVRIIEIPGVDLCACCAPHVAYTGQIGLIKLVGMANYKGGERIHMLSGARALADYQRKHQSVKQISALLCEKEEKIAEGVERLKTEQSGLKLELASMQKERLQYKAAEVEVGDGAVCVFDEKLVGDDLREIVNLLLERGASVCGAFGGTDQDGYRYVIGSKTEDVRLLNQKLKEKFGARGGGKPEMVQGSLTGTEMEIKALF